MNLSANLRLRFVLIAVCALAALGAGMMIFNRSSHSTPATPKQIKPLHPVRHGAAAPAQKSTAPSRSVQAPALQKQLSHARAAHKAATPRPLRVRALAGVPPSVALALAGHRVVVVELFDPRTALDKAAVNEAVSGARSVNAGFVALDVTKQAQAAPLAKVDGVLHDPGLLVFRRPGRLMLWIDGFADRETVAQAAVSFGAKAPAHKLARAKKAKVAAKHSKAKPRH